MITNLLFYCFSSLSLICAAMVVLSSNAVHSVLFLVLVFCNVSGLLFLIGAEFIALLFIIVYVGAIAVLFLFVVMMLNIRSNATIASYGAIFWVAILLTFLVLTQFLLTYNINFNSTNSFLSFINNNIIKTFNYTLWFESYSTITNMEVIGRVLYVEYSYLFILSSIILLVAMIGVIVLTLHQRTDVKKQNLSVQLARESSGVVRFVKTVVNT